MGGQALYILALKFSSDTCYVDPQLLNIYVKIFFFIFYISVCDEHKEFKDVKLFYRFRKDDGTFPLDNEVKVFMRGQRLYEKYVAFGIHNVLIVVPQQANDTC